MNRTTPLMVVDLSALAGVLGSLMGYMPAIVAVLAAIYYCISIALGIKELRK